MELHDYQKKAVDFLISSGRSSVGLFLRMGLGKTLCVLEYLSYLKLLGQLGRVLIIAPKTVAMYVWEQEIEKWGYDLSVLNLCGLTPHQRSKVTTSADIEIWNIDILCKMPIVNHDIVVIDELSMFKDSKSLRFRYLRKQLKYKPKVIGLTGTPAPNSLVQLWPQMFLLDRGEALGKYYGQYKDKYFFPTFTFNNIRAGYKIKPGAESMIYDALSKKVLAINIDSCKTPFTEQIFYCDLPPELMKKYKQLKEELTLDGIDGVNAQVVLTKLLQFTSGCVYKVGNCSGIVEYDTPKLPLLKDLISVFDDNALIAHWFKHEHTRFIQLGIDPISVDKWNEGKQKCASIHPASMGHGVNLQRGGSIIVWYTLPWSLELYEQTIARIKRQGQTKPVRNYILVCRNTIDEYVLQVLQGKKKIQEALMEALA
jgi:SNF2 family DNA or RNA helicase